MKTAKIINYLVGFAFLIAMFEGVISEILVWVLIGVAIGLLIVNRFDIKKINIFKSKV